ncbi:MAG TPA: porin [Vicinamibacteria bacterium]
MTRKVVRRGAVALAMLALSLAAVVNARAQGMFYAEETKDGRVYVFNVKANWERFKASGETGIGITRLNAGPNGETVYADSEQALELYFFKHDIKEAVVRPPAPVQTVVWRDGKTRFTLGSNFYLEMSNRIQVRWTDELPDDSIQLAGTAAKGDSKGSFRLRRAKFKLEGWFYKPELEYEVQLNWPDVSGTPPARMLEDADIDWDLSKAKNKAFRIRFGQFKAAYGRQQITSSGAQQFVDRASTDDRYNPGRETGVSLWGTLGVNKLDWRLMASNGNGRSQTANDNTKYLLTARVMWQPNGVTRMNQWASGLLLTEGDLGDSTDKPLFAIAGNWAQNDRSNATTGIDLKDDQFGGDYTFKFKGFASVGEYHHRKSKPETGAKFNDKGFLVQASYAVKAPKMGPAAFWEVAGRYVKIDPSSLRSGDDREELGVALNYYYNKHNLKVQADWRQLKDDAANAGAGTKNQEIRLQTQFIF